MSMDESEGFDTVYFEYFLGFIKNIKVSVFRAGPFCGKFHRPFAGAETARLLLDPFRIVGP